MGVKNDDNTDNDGNLYGDVQRAILMTVRDERQPALISSLQLKKNGSSYSGDKYSIGDKITMKALAADPKGLPLEYRFSLYVDGVFAKELQAWSSNSEATYTFTEEDLSNSIYITAGVRNNDGIDLNSMHGDSFVTVMIDVFDGRTPAKIDKFTVYKNGIEYSGTDFQVGDKIKIVVAASDERNLPLEYKFALYKQNMLSSTLSEFGSSNSVEYVFTMDDVITGISIFAGVKNNDGLDGDGEFFGDAHKEIAFSVKLANPYFYGNSYSLVSRSGPNGTLRPGDSFSTNGIAAKDPNNLPVQYAYYLDNCTSRKLLQDWSDIPDLSYHFVAEDLDSCLTLIIAVRNSDGVDAVSAELGDIYSPSKISLGP